MADIRRKNYKIVCDACGEVSYRTRKSAVVCHPEQYICRCGGRLRVETLKK